MSMKINVYYEITCGAFKPRTMLQYIKDQANFHILLSLIKKKKMTSLVVQCPQCRG